LSRKTRTIHEVTLTNTNQKYFRLDLDRTLRQSQPVASFDL
jgi:hypothetical protein